MLIIYKSRTSVFFPLVEFVEFVERGIGAYKVLKIRLDEKLYQFVLKIGPIGVLKFGSARKRPYLCAGIKR